MKREYSLAELATILGSPLDGEEQHRVCSIADLEAAGPTDLTFLAKQKYAASLEKTQAGCVLVTSNQVVPPGLNVIRVENPYLAYARLSGLFAPSAPLNAGVHAGAFVDPSAQIADTAVIGPNCVIEANVVIKDSTILRAGVFVGARAKIGIGCEIHPNATIYHDCVLGDRVKIHAATVIGSDGFGFAPSSEGWVKISQVGRVVIGNDVDIGASTSIDRGAIQDTLIGNGVIIDNQVHIAHNVRIGDHTALAGCVGIAGSAVIGKRCTVGGQVAINGHIEITDDVHIHGGSVVTKSLLEPGHYASGTPLQEVKQWRRNAVRVSQLDQWVEKIKKLEQAKDKP